MRYGADVTLLTDDPDNLNDSGYSILHEAVSMNCVGIVNLILQNRWVEAEMKTHSGQTPMHLAACRPHPAILKRLLGAGADVNAKDHFGHTPLFYAQKAKADDAVAVLLQKGAVAEINEAAAISSPSGTVATGADSGEEDLALSVWATLQNMITDPEAATSRTAARRVKQEVARAGLISLSCFFATSAEPRFARRRSPLSDRGSGPYHPSPRNDRQQVRIAATVLHWVFEVFIFMLGVRLMLSQAYNFFTYSYIIVCILGLLRIGGLLYLKVDLWLRPLPLDDDSK